MNVDGAVFAAKKEVGLSFIIRDARGFVNATLSKKFKAPLGAIEIETKAFEAGLQFAKEMRIQEFVIEGDSLTIFNALVEQFLAPISVAPIIYGILSSMHEF